MGGVGAFADCAHAVEGGYAEGAGKVAVAGAAGGCFAQGGRGRCGIGEEIGTEFVGQGLGATKELDGAAGSLHGRAVDAAFDGEGAAGAGCGLEGGEALFHAGAVGAASYAEVDFGPGFGGDDVGFGAAADDAGVEGDAFAQVSPGADFLDLAGELEDGGAAAGEVDAGVGGEAVDGDAPVAGAFAGGFIGEALGGLEDIDGAAFLGQLFGDGAGDWAADFFFAVEEEDYLVIELAGFGEHFDSGESHGDAGFHVECAGAVKTGLALGVGGEAAGHGFQGAEGPDCVEMAEQEDAVGGGFGAGAEAEFEDVAPGALTVAFYASSEGFCVGCGEVHAGVYGGFIVRGGFGED